MASGPNQVAAQLRELANDELVSKLRESKEELFNLRFQSATGQLASNHRLRVVRTDIARIYTVLRERELGIAVTPVAKPAAEAAPKRSTKSAKAGADKTGAAKAAAETEQPKSEAKSESKAEVDTKITDEVKA
jgi:large subunit ribosomal protein L29